MKKVVIIFIFFTAFFCSKSQNLVPNYSFEDTIQCIQHVNQFSGYVSDWDGGASGLCYFTSLCDETEDSVPVNFIGYQYPHTGHAYACIVTYGADTADGDTLTVQKNSRDYIQDKLTDSLKAGVTYYVTFYISLADSSWYYCNNIGAYLSDSALKYAPSYQYVKSYITPQIANNPLKVLSDTEHWTKITGSFVAKGGEKYIIIGNFNADNTSTIGYFGHRSQSTPLAFYYIDDVIVSADSNYADSLATVGIPNITRPDVNVDVYPNPANSMLNVEVQLPQGEVFNICLYNSLGEKVICNELNSNLTAVGISSLTSGIYYYRITDEKSNLIKANKVMIIR